MYSCQPPPFGSGNHPADRLPSTLYNIFPLFPTIFPRRPLRVLCVPPCLYTDFFCVWELYSSLTIQATVQLYGNLCKKACCKLACINAFLYKLTYDGHQSFLFSCFLKTRRCMAELLPIQYLFFKFAFFTKQQDAFLEFPHFVIEVWFPVHIAMKCTVKKTFSKICMPITDIYVRKGHTNWRKCFLPGVWMLYESGNHV